jgi:hypothetical protein
MSGVCGTLLMSLHAILALFHWTFIVKLVVITG